MPPPPLCPSPSPRILVPCFTFPRRSSQEALRASSLNPIPSPVRSVFETGSRGTLMPRRGISVCLRGVQTPPQASAPTFIRPQAVPISIVSRRLASTWRKPPSPSPSPSPIAPQDRLHAAEPPPSTGPPRLIRYPPRPNPKTLLPPDYYPAPHYYTPPSPLGASALIAKHRAAAARRRGSRIPVLPFFQFRSSLAEVDFDSPIGWAAQQNPLTWQATKQSNNEALRQQRQESLPGSQQTDIGVHQARHDDQAPVTPSSQQDSMTQHSIAMPASGSGTGVVRQRANATHAPEKSHEHEHGQGHSHGLFGHSHSHSHDHGSPEEADRLIAALKGKGESAVPPARKVTCAG